ncbi:MAG: DUF3899 domain-containing protein [Ruminococcaceae bacterium]|nr:DUF3899 domain-containing protein [Oscillospiraceae bacterium]
MKKENKSLWIKWLICFGVASLITLGVFFIKNFFTDNVGRNIQVLADGFSVSGLLMTMFAGLLFVSGEGAFIGIGFIMRSVALTFIPMGRKKHELYRDYRERKVKELKKQSDVCVLVTGLVFLFVGIVFNVIWLVCFYNVV